MNIATTTEIERTLEIERIRADFPILKSKVGGKPLVYLDNAASSQMPQPVIDRLVRYQTAAQAAALHQRTRRARSAVHQRHDRGDQPRDARLRAQVYR